MTSPPREKLGRPPAPQETGEETGETDPGDKVFGVPLGGLGLLPSFLMALSVGIASFFLVTFLAIVGIGIYNAMGHSVNFADSYKLIALPAGCLMLAVGFIFFGTLWLRHKFAKR